jgi:hypothetical protein
VDGKTLTVNNSLALTGADSKTLNIGANNLTFTTTADTNITLPTTGTLVSSDVTTLSSLVNISTGLTGVVKATSGALTTMTGTPGYSARWTDANTLGNAVIYDNGTNVGIGSSAPQAKLDVEGSAYFGNGNVGIGTSAATGKLEVLGGGTTTGVTFRTRDSTGAVRVTVLDNGNVGIGTTAPVGALEVSGRVAVTPSAVTNITAVGGVTVTSGVMRIQGSGGAVNITADPQISAGTDGEILILIGQSNVNTVRFDDGAGMQIAGGTSFTMGLYDTLQLVYDAGTGFWVEVGRSNN